MHLPTKQQLRRLWLKVHKWLGLLMAIPIALIFLSGSLLVWKDSLDELLQTNGRVSSAPVHAASYYADSLERVLPPSEKILSLTFPKGNGAVVITTATSGSEAPMAAQARYYLDRATGTVLGHSSGDAGPLRFVHVLHGSLLLGRPGARLVGAVALGLLLSVVSGLWLWWPMKGSFVRGMRWQRTQSTNANIHHQAGYWIAIPLVVLSLTGASISFPGFFNALVGDTAAVQAEAVRASAAPLRPSRTSLAQALAAAGAPQSRTVAGIAWPTGADPRWKVDFKDGRRAVAVDDVTGRVTSIDNSEPESAARLMRRIHDGTEMPWIWRFIIFTAGLLGPLLAVTGTIIWLSGRRRGKQMRNRRVSRAH